MPRPSHFLSLAAALFLLPQFAFAEPVKIALPVASLESMPIYVAEDKGLFKKHGLDIDVITSRGGGEAMKAYIAGEVQIVATGFPELGLMRAENVELGLELRGEPKARRRATALALIGQYGLAGFERKYPHALSGGMQKRAALAQTLALNPEVLLLDEPFAALDAQTRVVIENDVVKICRAGRRSMVIVTHDIAEAISMADRVVMLSRRPASVKEVFEIPFSRQAGSVADVPAMPEFARYFKRIWDALDISVTGMGAAA